MCLRGEGPEERERLGEEGGGECESVHVFDLLYLSISVCVYT